MASRHTLLRAVLARQLAKTPPGCPGSSTFGKLHSKQHWTRRPPCPFHPVQQVRWHSAAPSYSRVYQFDEMKALSDSPSQDRVLIDVREPTEFEAGSIPTSINIPISSQPDALMLPPEEFEDRFGFEKPATDTEVVFYCKAGVRSSAAAKLASQSGYSRIGEYRGSWLDWNKNSGRVQHKS